MSQSSRTQRIIVIDDDDDVDMTANGANPSGIAPNYSPPASLNNLSPAVSVSTSSSGSMGQHLDSFSNGNGSASVRNAHALDKYRTGYVFAAEMMLHTNSIDPDHPEKPVRIQKIHQRLKGSGLLEHMKRVKIRPVTKDEVMLVHQGGMWDGVERTAFFDPDLLKEQVPMLEAVCSLYANEHSAYAARLSCGGAIELCDAIATGRIHNGFAIIRPPGHHAEPHKSMGFCFYNNVAVATKYLQKKYPESIRKVLILDWDVHHGNGTQRAFEDDPDVLYISLHRYDEDGSFYPGTTYGNYTSVGTGRGKGRSVNVPWPIQGMGDGDYLYAFQHLIMPIAHEFKPDFVIISAGFDAALGDPIGLNRVTPAGYAQMTHALASLCRGKLAVVLEGGYNPDVVAESALAVTQVLLAQEPAEPEVVTASTIGAMTVQRVCRHQQQWWNSIVVSDLEVDDVDFDSPDAPPSYKISELAAEFRNKTIAAHYDLFEVPLDDTIYRNFEGQVLCSEDILDAYSTIVFFIHDMGNFRLERPGLGLKMNEEGMRLVDSSKLVLDYAQSNGFGIVDMNIVKELSAIRETAPESRRRTGGISAVDDARLKEAAEAAAFVWDNVVSLATTSRDAKNVILVGSGTGCNVLMKLIESRQHPEQIKGIVNVVGYDEMPCVGYNESLNNKKKYYTKSMVLAPADHPYLIGRGGAKPLTRYGKIKPVEDVRAINILNHQIEDIKEFVNRKLRIANSAPRSG